MDEAHAQRPLPTAETVAAAAAVAESSVLYKQQQQQLHPRNINHGEDQQEEDTAYTGGAEEPEPFGHQQHIINNKRCSSISRSNPFGFRGREIVGHFATNHERI